MKKPVKAREQSGKIPPHKRHKTRDLFAVCSQLIPISSFAAATEQFPAPFS